MGEIAVWVNYSLKGHWGKLTGFVFFICEDILAVCNTKISSPSAEELQELIKI